MSENRTSRASRRRRGENGAHAIRICPGGEMTEESADPAIARRRRRREVVSFHFSFDLLCIEYELASFRSLINNSLDFSFFFFFYVIQRW